MKVTIDVPDELYRQVKAKSALEGRAVREVAIELFRSYLEHRPVARPVERPVAEEAAHAFEGREIPAWFGTFEDRARGVRRHDMEAIRESIARGVSAERAR